MGSARGIGCDKSLTAFAGNSASVISAFGNLRAAGAVPPHRRLPSPFCEGLSFCHASSASIFAPRAEGLVASRFLGVNMHTSGVSGHARRLPMSAVQFIAPGQADDGDSGQGLHF